MRTSTALLLLAISQLGGQDLGTGTVQSADGAPLGRVWVQELGTSRGGPTKPDGAFTFPLGKPATLLFVKDGFRPQLLSTKGGEREITVAMQIDSDGPSLRSCGQKWLGALPEMQITGASNLRVEHGAGPESIGYSATYTNGKETAILESVTGFNIGALTPRPDWVKGLSSFSARSIKCGGAQWVDLRGATGAGLRPRWIGTGGSYLEYSKIAEEAAGAFDRAIESACCPE